MDRIKIYKGEENGIVREIENYSESLFSEQYALALTLLDHHIETINNTVEESEFTVAYPKVVAFCGERGEGKTSCMMSFCRMIKSADIKEGEIAETELGKFCSEKHLTCDNVSTAAKEMFWAEPIDPAFFDNTHNILELIVGRMYKRYLDICNNPQNNKTSKEIDDLAKVFGELKRSLTQLDKGKSNAYDPIEDLDDLAVGSELCNRLCILFREYCKFNGKKTLVITIDDIDLNIEGAYQMVEYIRKYLTNKYCVVLMSVKLSQLIDVVSNYYSKKITGLNATEADKMATNYVNKLIPQGFRVTMPKVYDICHTGLDIYESRQEGLEPKTFHSVKEAVVNLIFNKTRYLFYNSKGAVSPIVPNNLRSLRHLIGMLYDMKDVYKAEEPEIGNEGEQDQGANNAPEPAEVSFDNIIENRPDIDKAVLESNKRLFKNYFYNTWVKQLSVENQLLAYKLVNSGDIVSLNKQVIAHLESSIPASEEDKKDEFTRLVSMISNPGNFDYNISVGDVFFVMDFLERSSNNQELKLLIFFLKSFYSIKLYECYDKITEERGEFAPEHNPKVGEIYRSDPWFSRANAMQRLVNGSFFTYLPTTALPPQASISERESFNRNRDIKVIDGSKLHELLKEVKSKMDEYDGMEDAAEKLAFEKKFRTCEFFVFTIVTSLTRKEAERQDFWMAGRSNSAPIVLSDFNGYAGYYLIDLLAPFYTILNPKFAYMRHALMKKVEDAADDDTVRKKKSENFYTFAIRHEFSLLNSLIRQVWIKEQQDSDNNFTDEDESQAKAFFNEDKKKPKGLKRLISNAAIRNSEVLTSVWEGIDRRRALRFESESYQKVMAFYQSMLETSMRTYPYDEDERTPYIMKFGFLNAFVKFLSDNPQEWKEIYESGVKLTDNKDKTKVELLFAKLFDFVKTSRKGKKIKEFLQGEMPDVYARRSVDAWNQIFEEGKMYKKTMLAAHLQEFFADDAAQVINEVGQQQQHAEAEANANPEQPNQVLNE